MDNTYFWVGRSANNKKIFGIDMAHSVLGLRAAMQDKKMTITHVLAVPCLFCVSAKARAKWAEKFLKQLSELLGVGMDLSTVLRVISDANTYKHCQRMLVLLLKSVEEGESLGSVMRCYPNYFNEIVCQLVEVSEASGRLALGVKSAEQFQARRNHMRQAFTRALRYPLVLLAISIFIVWGVSAFVIPEFEKLYESFNRPIPGYTIFVMGVSHWARVYGVWLIVAVTLSGSVLRKKMQANDALRLRWELLMFHLPLIGKLAYNFLMARWLRQWHMLQASGIPVLDALKVLADAEHSAWLKRVISRVSAALYRGMSISDSMASTRLFQKDFLEMAALGESTGNWEKTLDSAATYHEREGDVLSCALRQWLEPAIMVFVGVMVGSLVIAMYLPIFKFGTTL